MQQTLAQVSQVTKVLRARRLSLKMSQADVAAKVGIHQSYLSAIEGGQRVLSVQRLLELANVLDLELVVQDKQRATGSEW
jgi:HTH-type transcriptional regulator / antitoxin HipB